MPTDGDPAMPASSPVVTDLARSMERLAARGELIRQIDEHGESTFSAAQPASLPVVLAITFVGSLGTGLLWTGVPFVAEHDFGFSKAANLWLAAAEGVAYVGVAFLAGPLLRALARGRSTRSVLMQVLMAQALVCPLPLLGAWGVVIGAILISAISALLWPIMESYLSSGRHGHRLRWSVGLFNMTWTSAVAASLFLMAPLFATDSTRLAVVAIGPCCLAAACLLPWLPLQPPPHLAGAQHAPAPPVYTPLRDATRLLLPTSYLLIGALGPLLPYVITRLEVAATAATPLAATWLTVRVVAMLGMWRLPFWHGRWSTLVVGSVLMGSGFVAAVNASNVPMLVAALAAFGTGHAVIYYASLYYAMTVGHAAVDAGGHFEALIGSGYVLGPLASLLGVWLGGGEPWFALTLAAIASLMAVRAWLRWRITTRPS
ncbi:MAG: hypothetical protein RLZZ558_1840 [Planctomycetota bacterium]